MEVIGSLISGYIFFTVWDYLVKKLKPMFAKVKKYFKKIYRLLLSPAKREAVVWKDLKKLFVALDLRHGVFESRRYIEAFFRVDEHKVTSFFSSKR